MKPLFFIFNVTTIIPHGVKLFLRQPNAQISTKISVRNTTPKHKRASEWILDEVPKPCPIAKLFCAGIEPPHISKAIVQVAGHTVLEVGHRNDGPFLDPPNQARPARSGPPLFLSFLVQSFEICGGFGACFWVVASFWPNAWPNVSSRFAFS